VLELTAGGLSARIAAGSEIGRRYRANFDTLYVDQRRPFVVVATGWAAARETRWHRVSPWRFSLLLRIPARRRFGRRSPGRSGGYAPKATGSVS